MWSMDAEYVLGKLEMRSGVNGRQAADRYASYSRIAHIGSAKNP